jgi:glycosyltransferase involved in cell wall biosynthesis
MHIGHYAPHLWAPGGIAAYVRRLGTAQSDRGHTIVYLSRTEGLDAAHPETQIVDDDRDLFERAASLNLDILHVHKHVDLPDTLPLPIVRTMHGHQASCPSGNRFLSRSGRPCDRVPGLTGCLWGHVVDRCGSIRPRQLAGGFVRLRSEVDFVRRVPTLTVSHFLRRRMIEAGCPESQMQVIPSPAPEVDRVVPIDPSNPPRFLFLGRLAPQKGILWLLRSFAQLDEEAHLDVAGEGNLRSAAEGFVRKHGLEDRVTFHGWVDRDQVTALFRSARAVVFPSVWHEPAGLVSLEAAAHGRALIASRVGGIPEYASEEFATLVPPNDVSALTAAMASLSRDPDRAARMGRAGRQSATSNFTMDRFVRQLDGTYGSVTRDFGNPAPASQFA